MKTKWRTFKVKPGAKKVRTAASILYDANVAREAYQHSRGPLDSFLKRYVFIEQGNLVGDLKTPPYCAVTKLEEFRNATDTDVHIIPAPTKTEPDKEKTVPVHSAWLRDPLRKTAKGVSYDPAKPFYFEGIEHASQESEHKIHWWVNEFYMPKFVESDSDTSVFHDHMEYLFPVKRERTWFIDWMGYNLQYPEKRCKVTPLHISIAHGTGRGWLVELMGKLLGQWNCTKTKMDTLCGEGSGGGFTDYLNKSIFCAIEEVRESDQRYAVSDKTRDILTENTLEVNVKYGTKRTQQVFTNFFFMSNHPDALVLTKEDRRINVFSGPEEVRDKEYYRSLYNWLETDAVAALFHKLKKRELKDFDFQYAMNTPAKAAMIENNQTDTEYLLHELMESPDCPPALLFCQIAEELRYRAGNPIDDVIDEKQLPKLLQKCAVPTARRMSFFGRKGKQGRVWVLNKAIRDNTDAIRESVEEYQKKPHYSAYTRT